MNEKKFGLLVSSLRKNKGWSQDELAERLGVYRQTISRWERGIGFPEIDLLYYIARLFDVTIDELLEGKLKEKNINYKYIFLSLFSLLFIPFFVIIFLHFRKMNKVYEFEFKTDLININGGIFIDNGEDCYFNFGNIDFSFNVRDVNYTIYTYDINNDILNLVSSSLDNNYGIIKYNKNIRNNLYVTFYYPNGKYENLKFILRKYGYGKGLVYENFSKSKIDDNTFDKYSLCNKCYEMIGNKEYKDFSYYIDKRNYSLFLFIDDNKRFNYLYDLGILNYMNGDNVYYYSDGGFYDVDNNRVNGIISKSEFIMVMDAIHEISRLEFDGM